METLFTFIEFVVALILIFAASSLVYLFGRHLSPKSIKTEGGESSYACGETATFSKLRINVSLYRYLIYFVVLDSSVLMVAFASLSLSTLNFLGLLIYLFIMLAAGFLLVGGGDQ
jgi:NADH:ubiquinone oxidoreductase subunit 3 (subunit A)